MEQTDLDLIIERTGGARPVMISRRFLSKAAQGALISDQSAAKEMSFIITIGYADPKGYHESSRHSIKVNSSNPQIAEILEEAKRIPLPWGMSDHKDYLFLERAKDNEELDPSKTARDYNLESGEVLRLFSSLR
jgi:hypothetical protein